MVLLLLFVAMMAPAQVTITATHQPREALATQIGRIPRGLAMYEVIACGRGEISTARVRQVFAQRGLTLLAPSLGVVVAERERARGWSAALGSLPDLAPLATVGMAAAGAPQAGMLASAGVSALIAGLRAGRDARPVAMADPARLVVDSACASYLTLARWPSRGRGPEVVTVEVR
jgi:hypothetical protein